MEADTLEAEEEAEAAAQVEEEGETVMMMTTVTPMEEDRSSVVREAQGIKVAAIKADQDQAAVAAATGA